MAHRKDIESLEASNKECKKLSGELEKLKIDLKTVEDKVIDLFLIVDYEKFQVFLMWLEGLYIG